MKSEIEMGLKNDEIVIIDTVMLYFVAINNVMPKAEYNAYDAFVISIDVIRNKLLTKEDADRMNITLNKQIELFGTRSKFSWLPDVILLRLNEISSLSIVNDITLYGNNIRPRMSTIMTWKK